jgi:hypothetical protein
MCMHRPQGPWDHGLNTVQGVIEESIEAFRSRLQMASDDDDDEAFSEKLMNVSRGNDCSNIATLPRPSDSP